MAHSFKTTYDFNKLKNKLNTIMKDQLNVLGNGIYKAIQDGIDAGKDIDGNSFEPLHEITTMTGGSKILDRTGTMKQTKKDPAKENDLNFVITMTGKSSRTGKYHFFIFTSTRLHFFRNTKPFSFFYLSSRIP